MKIGADEENQVGEIEERLRVYNILAKNPSWVEILKDALIVERQKEKEYREKGYGESPGWEAYDVNVYPPVILFKMMGEKILDVPVRSRSTKFFKIRDPQLVLEAIEALEEAPVQVEEEGKIPKDLFEIIVGYEDIKRAFKLALASSEPVGILLYGPPATAKTLFLEELSRIPGSRYVLGSTFSKAGLLEYLLDWCPRYLLIDEIERSDGRDLAVLLSLMQTGIVTRLKKGMKEQITLKTWVFAVGNDITRLPREIKSRFLMFPVDKYTEAQFKQITLAILRRDGIDPALANYITDSIVPNTRDIRDGLKIGRLSKSARDVDELVRLIWKR